MKQNIKIKIAGDEYQLAVDPDLEEGIRAAADRINENVDYLLDHYGNVSPKQVLGIVLLREEVKLIELQKRNDSLMGGCIVPKDDAEEANGEEPEVTEAVTEENNNENQE